MFLGYMLQAMLILVACGELKLKSHSFVCVASEALWGDSHILLFSPLPAISEYVLPPFWSLVFLHLGVVCNHIKDNTVLEYNFPCKKDDGFFFFPIAKVHKLISMGKCSEMDMLLDMWIHTIYNDPSVQGSYSGPVVYYRNHTGNPVTSFQTLGDRWNHSKTTISRTLKKFEEINLKFRSEAAQHLAGVRLFSGIPENTVHRQTQAPDAG